jgi:ferrous iron transport protein B
MEKTYVVGVVGNPNCGKTTLFNAFTGAKQRVGNWPGVTVERKTGRFAVDGIEFELVDLPGTYSLEVADEEVSLDERIARDYVASGAADLVVNIVDASNLERNLYLTSQLLEMRVPMIVALNMMDVAEEAGLAIDLAALRDALGCPVVPIVASAGKGIAELKAVVRGAAQKPHASRVLVPYPPAVERALAEVVPSVTVVATRHGLDPRWLAARLLEGDGLAVRMVGDGVAAPVAALRARVEAELGDDIDIGLADARYGFANGIVARAMKRKGRVSSSVSDKIDGVVLNRALGIPIFLLAMYLMFMFTIGVGGAFIDAFDIVTGAIVVDGFGALLGSIGAPEWLIVLLANGAGGGIQVVATFVPVVAFLFLFLSFLEDSGYMARAAFVMDRFLRAIGLPGKSFVPLLVGFGCTVPAVMATRTLENERERKMTIAMSNFMSCGARLPVYALFAAAFFTAWAQQLVFLMYLLGVAAAVFTGLVLKHTLLRGKVTPFVMELPPYRLPTVRGVLLRTWDRTKSFVVRAGRVIVPLVLVLNVLNSVGTDGSLGNEDSDASVLSAIGRTITPVFTPFGVTEENWPASVGIFTGFLAKEAVVGTLDALYAGLGEEDGAALQSQVNPRPLSWLGDGAPETLPVDDEPLDLLGLVGEGLATIPANLAAALQGWLDPMGLNIGDVADPAAAAEAQEVAASTFGAMATRFGGTAAAFAYLLFVLLYVPCVAAMAAVRRETTPAWTAFVATWTTGLAYLSATLFYQIATFAQHPASSAAWIAGCLGFAAIVIAIMRALGQRATTPRPAPAAARA